MRELALTVFDMRQRLRYSAGPDRRLQNFSSSLIAGLVTLTWTRQASSPRTSKSYVSAAERMELSYVSRLSADPPIGTRAGFWRRFLTYLIDIIIVWMPIQIIAAFLFATTSGWIQEIGGVTYTS